MPRDSVLDSAIADAMLAVLTGSDLWLGLGTDTADPTIEATGTDYVRVLLATATGWDAAADYSETVDAVLTVIGRLQQNAAEIVMGTVGAGGWGTLYWLQFWSASSAGTLQAAARLTNPQVTVEGNDVKIPASNLRTILKGAVS